VRRYGVEDRRDMSFTNVADVSSPILRRLFFLSVLAILLSLYVVFMNKPLLKETRHPYKIDSQPSKLGPGLPVIHRRVKNRTVVVESEWLEYKVGSDYGDGTCGKSHNVNRLRGILRRWHDIATQNNITYFLTYGSLIAATRDGNFVPWDTDLDIYTDMRDNVKLDAIQNKRNFDTRSDSFHLVLDVDWRVFPVTSRRRVTCDGKMNTRDSCTFNGPVGRLIKGYEKYLDIWDLEIINGMAYDRYGPGYHYPLEDIYPLKKCKLSGITAFCPKNPKVIFDAFYGKDAKMAPGWRCRKGRWIKQSWA